MRSVANDDPHVPRRTHELNLKRTRNNNSVVGRAFLLKGRSGILTIDINTNSSVANLTIRLSHTSAVHWSTSMIRGTADLMLVMIRSMVIKPMIC